MERSRIGRGAKVRRAIIDQDNDVPAHERIGFNAEEDRKRFAVTDSGIVVVPAGFFPPRAKRSPYLARQAANDSNRPRVEVLA
jgi:glucose-1-phosphate adenylyltransferase